MSNYSVVTPSNLGKGFDKNVGDMKIHIKVDGTTIEFDANQALHAIFPEILKKAVTGIELKQGNGEAKLVCTIVEGNPIEIDISALATDINVSGAEYNPQTTVLTLVREDESDITVDLGKLAESATENTSSVLMSGKGTSTDPLKADVQVSKVEDNKIEIKDDGLFASSELRVVTDYSKLPQGFLAELITGIGQPLSVTNGSNGPGGGAADLYDKRGRDVIWASLGKPEDNVLANPKLRAKLDGYNPSWYTSSRELSRIINESGEYINSPSDFTDYIEVLEHIPTGLYFPATRPNAEQRSIIVTKVSYLNTKETLLTKENIPSFNLEPSDENIPVDVKEEKERNPNQYGEIHESRTGVESGYSVTGRYLVQGDLEVIFELPSDISKEDFESLMVNRFNQPTENKAEREARDIQYDKKYLGAKLDLRKKIESAGYDYNKNESWIEYNGNRDQYRFGVPFISLDRYDIPIGYDDMNQVITEQDGKTFVTVTFTNYSILSNPYYLGKVEEVSQYGGFLSDKLNEPSVEKQDNKYIVNEQLKSPGGYGGKSVNHVGLEGKHLLQYTSINRIDGLFQSIVIDTPNTETYPVTYTKAGEE